MKNRILFSIITVCYNAEECIERTITSVLNQKYANYEYIIIDGKSSDNTLDIIKKYNSQIDTLISVVVTSI
jgi:glycosyltransferase involved in cell wall biosynthesis